MTKTSIILSYVAKNPGCESTDLAIDTGLSRDSVSAILSLLNGEKKVTRTVSRYIGLKKIYAYYPANVISEKKPIEKKPVEKKLIEKEILNHSDKFERLTDSIADSLVEKIMEKVKIKLSQEIQDLIPILEKRTDFIESIVRTSIAKKKKTILIIGLLPQQCGIIQNQFGQEYNFHFWKEESPKKLRDQIRGSDYIFTFTSKIGHHVEEIIKSENVEFTRIKGGMTSLKNAINYLTISYKIE